MNCTILPVGVIGLTVLMEPDVLPKEQMVELRVDVCADPNPILFLECQIASKRL